MTPLEPWEKVFIELKGSIQSFAGIDQTHALIGCVNCHGGTEPASYTNGFYEAHDSTTFIKDPSLNPEQNCNPCHAAKVESNKNSMHSMAWGERTAIAQREGGAGFDHNDFDGLPEALTDGFDGDCTSCHTTCGQCHVSRPNSVHGGFINSHKFSATPDQTNNCMACHGTRISVDFKGSLTDDNKPDVHYLDGKKCWDCHKEDMHADASSYATRYHMVDMDGYPTCNGCHSADIASNNYHLEHWPGNGDGLSCFVCHSQPYYNCNSCHTNGEWQEGYAQIGDTDVHTGDKGYSEYPEFRIGYNYDMDLHDGKWIVVRHIPVSADSYEPWGHAILAEYGARPTWEYTSPHNIRRFTAQTDTTGGASCSENCHLKGANAELNGKRFLWQSFIDSAYTEEVEANLPVVVDDHLPSGWLRY